MKLEVARRLTLACSFLLLTAAAADAVSMPRAFPKRAGGPVVAFDAGRVRATGATPGAMIYFAGVSLYTADEMLHLVKGGGAVSADASGNAEFLTAVHTRSVWLVVDAAKGYTVAAPHGMLLREMEFPGEAQENAVGQLRRLLLRRFNVDVFLIRPDAGLWTAYFRDGGPLDGDAEPNGQNHGDLGDMEPVGSTVGKPERFAPHDYLFLVDRNSLEFHVTRRGAQ